MIHGTIKDLQALLDLTAAGDNEFSGNHVADARARVYGGQFLGQGLIAASRLCPGPVQSFHCYYIRPGMLDAPLTYTTARLSNSLVAVLARQHGKVLFSMDVAFGDYQGGPHATMPRVPPPARCIPREEGIQGLDNNTDSTWAVTDSPFDYRFVENIWQDGFSTPGHSVWFRARDVSQVGPDMSQTMAQAMTAYFSDDPIMDNALFPHGWHRAWTELQTASLDHAMWFHAPVDLRRWLLFAQDSPVAAGGRALARGQLFDEQGTLIASAAQEILMRVPGEAAS
ncbi:MAG: thioesterase family protein [Gammaproteobacteria bacterium]|nr:thioesterase family protein [Gammaproteobacteria bacterium]